MKSKIPQHELQHSPQHEHQHATQHASLLEPEIVLSPEHSPSFKGILLLTLLMLIVAILLLAVDNIREKGILVDISLLRCMSGDTRIAIELIFGIYALCFIMWILSWKKWKSNKVLYYGSAIMYILCELIMLYSVVYIIVSKKISIGKKYINNVTY
jgi:hypothetical protein